MGPRARGHTDKFHLLEFRVPRASAVWYYRNTGITLYYPASNPHSPAPPRASHRITGHRHSQQETTCLLRLLDINPGASDTLKPTTRSAGRPHAVVLHARQCRIQQYGFVVRGNAADGEPVGSSGDGLGSTLLSRRQIADNVRNRFAGHQASGAGQPGPLQKSPGEISIQYLLRLRG